MSTIYTIGATFREDGTATLLARVTARDGTGATQASGRKLLKQADLSAIAIKVFNVADPSTAVLDTALTIANVIFDTLQTDWDADSTGYNFKTTLASTVLATGGALYRAEVKFTTTGGTIAWAVWQGQAEPVFSS